MKRTISHVPLWVLVLGTLLLVTSTARATWQQISRVLSLQGAPVPASANVLSEHEIEALDAMAPQHQAELLLERSINHYAGANEQNALRVGGWHGAITPTERLNNLFMTAINSDDLRVRAAGIELNIVGRNLEKTAATIDRLEPEARAGDQALRANALWIWRCSGTAGSNRNV